MNYANRIPPWGIRAIKKRSEQSRGLGGQILAVSRISEQAPVVAPGIKIRGQLPHAWLSER